MTYPSIVNHVSGEMSSKVEVSHTGYAILGAVKCIVRF